MSNKTVNEIFYSLQGEGYHAGRPVIFIRFSNCNLQCPFCDTDFKTGTMMTDEEILNVVKTFPCNFIVLTGGEPALQIDSTFINLLHGEGKTVAIETNGTRPIPENLDWITVSPKCDFCKHAEVVLKKADEVKIVFPCPNPQRYLTLISATHHYLQPCDTGKKEENKQNLEQCISYCLEHPEWSLSLQLHKLIGVK